MGKQKDTIQELVFQVKFTYCRQSGGLPDPVHHKLIRMRSYCNWQTFLACARFQKKISFYRLRSVPVDGFKYQQGASPLALDRLASGN